MDDDLALAGAPRQVDLRHILDIFLRETSQNLNALLESLPEQQDADRKQMLLSFLHGTKQRLLRLIVVSKWAPKARVIAEVGRILDVAARQSNACRDVADQLSYLHGELEAGHIPAYDVFSALTVLRTGTYRVLPSCIEELAGPPEPPLPAQQAATMRLMDHILRVTLLQEDVPAGVSIVSIKDAVATLQCGKEWEAKLTLVPAPPAPPVAPADVHKQGPPVLEGGRPEAREEGLKLQSDPEAVENSAGAEASGPVPMLTDSDVQPTPEEPKGAMGQNWRWRVLTADVLHACGRRDTIIAPNQASQLSGAVEIRMWSAADAQQQKQRSTAEAEKEPCSSAQHEAAAKQGASSAGDQQKPLHILHGILRDVASRLALNEAVVWVRNAAKTPPWAKLLRVEKSLLFSMGVRVSYWLDTPVVHPDSLQQLLKEDPSTDDHLHPPLNASRKGQADMHVPPAIEIGIAESGQLAVMSAPALPAAPDEAHLPQSTLSLALDYASLDTEAVLLQAAAANACVQLGALQEYLSRGAVLRGNNGSASISTTSAVQAEQSISSHSDPPAAFAQSPLLVLCSRGEAILEVSMHLRTGRAQLKLPAQQTGSLSHDCSAGHLLKKEEARLSAIQKEVLGGPTDIPGGKALRATQRMARSLEQLWVHLNRQQHFGRLLAAAEQLGMRRVQLPVRILQDLGLANNAKAGHISFLTLALPMRPFFPASLQWRQDGKKSANAKAMHTHAASVQLYLIAQLGNNLGWQLRTAACSCSASLLPLKALRVVDIPAAHPAKPSEQLPNSSSSSGRHHRKRKRPDAEEGGQDTPSEPLPAGQSGRPAEAAAGGKGAAAISMAAPDKATWDVEYPAGLKEVVRWCTEQQSWPLVQCELQAMSLSVTEEMQLGQVQKSQSAILPAQGGEEIPAITELPNGDAHAEQYPVLSNGDSHPEVIEGDVRFHRMLTVPQNKTLQLLDFLTENSKAGTARPVSSVAFLAGKGSTLFRLDLDSSYLAGLPDNSDWTDAKALNACSISQSGKGITLSYDSASGYTAGHALEDLHCIMQLHMSIARIRALMYASAHPSSTPAPCQHDSSAMPANGVHVSAQAQHSTAEPSESLEGSVKHKRPLSGEAGDMQVLRAKHSRQVADISINGQPHDREHHAASKGVDGAPSIGDDISSLRWQCQHSSMVSIVTVGCSFAQLHVALKSHVSQAAAPVEPDQIQDNVKPAKGIGVTLESPLPQLKVTLHWSCGNSAGSGPPASVSLGNPSAKRTAAALEHWSRCHVIAEPEIHASASEELAAMAEAAQEELFLDALSICGTPLAILGQVMAPAALLDLELLPEEVTLEPIRPPYKYLLVCKVNGQGASFGLHFLANSLVWLSLSDSRNVTQLALLQELCSLPKTHAVEQWRSRNSAGLWVEHAGFPVVLRHILTWAAGLGRNEG